MKSAETKYPERINQDNILAVGFELNNGTHAQVDVLEVVPGAERTGIPTIVIPGFTEGITQDAKFADFLCEFTEDRVYVIGQYERESKKMMGAHSALENQAAAVLAVIDSLGLEEKPVNVFANSLGAPVFARAAEIAQELGWTCFTEEAGAKAVLMAPAGLKQDDNAAKVGARFVASGLTAHSKEEHGWDEDSLKAGPKLIGADVKKAGAEAVLAAITKINFGRLAELGVKTDIITSPKDSVMGQKALGESIIKLLEDGHIESWSTPYSPVIAGEKRVKELKELGYTKKEADVFAFNGSSGAEHNTHMVNNFQAERTAQAVANLLEKRHLPVRLFDFWEYDSPQNQALGMKKRNARQ